jgi:diguanylate cyclase (GGDEF)-like protein
VGEVGLANRSGGYDRELLEALSPVIAALGQVIVARWDREARDRAEADLRALATTDPLTGLANRRVLLDRLEVLMARARRFSEPVALIMLDIDDFKVVNDSCGHDVGDQVLKDVARILLETSRDVDLPVRWGGEEFLLLLPSTDLPSAESVAEWLRGRIEQHAFGDAGSLTVSIGISGLKDLDTADSLIGRADQALYASKSRGKNCVSLER